MFGIGDDSEDGLPLEEERTIEAEAVKPSIAEEPEAVPAVREQAAPAPAPAPAPTLSGYTKATPPDNTLFTLLVAGGLLWLLSKRK